MLFRTRTLRFAALVVIIAAGGISGTALARQGSASPLQAALAKTAAAGSSRFTFAFTVSGVTGLPGGAISLTGSGAADSRHGSAIVHLNLGALAKSLGALAGGAALPPTIDIVVVHNVLYVHLAALAKQLAPGKEWLKLDPRTLPKSTTGGANLGELSTIGQKQALAALTGAVNVEKVGSDKVRGTPATHYSGSVDISSFALALPKSQQAAFLQGVKQVGLKKIPLDIWIDGSSYVRRISAHVDHLKVQAAGPAVSFRMSVDSFGFGAKLKIKAPPAAKTADASKLLGQIAGGAGTGSG